MISCSVCFSLTYLLSKIPSKFIHVALNGKMSFFFMIDCTPCMRVCVCVCVRVYVFVCVCVFHIFFLHSSIDGHLGSFHIFSSVQFSHSVMSNSLRPHKPQHTRPPCPSPTPGVHPNPCPLSQWCHPAISSSVIPFSSCLQSFPASGSFQMSQLFTSGDQNVGVSASTSVLPMNIQDWFLLGLTDLMTTGKTCCLPILYTAVCIC